MNPLHKPYIHKYESFIFTMGMYGEYEDCTNTPPTQSSMVKMVLCKATNFQKSWLLVLNHTSKMVVTP